jgi:hypothetical protein
MEKSAAAPTSHCPPQGTWWAQALLVLVVGDAPRKARSRRSCVRQAWSPVTRSSPPTYRACHRRPAPSATAVRGVQPFLARCLLQSGSRGSRDGTTPPSYLMLMPVRPWQAVLGHQGRYQSYRHHQDAGSKHRPSSFRLAACCCLLSSQEALGGHWMLQPLLIGRGLPVAELAARVLRTWSRTPG